jgi:hypothetical protein
MLNRAILKWPQQNNFYILRGRTYMEMRHAMVSLLESKSKRIQRYEKKRLTDCAMKDFKDAKAILLKNKEEEDSRTSQRRQQQREI